VSRFETETVAELMWQQGHLEEAVALCLRLASRATGEERRRLTGKASAWRGELARVPRKPGPAVGSTAVAAPRSSPEQAPAVSLTLRGGSSLAFAWSLPRSSAPSGASPAAELFLARRTPGGVDVQRRLLPLGAISGSLELPVAALHSARVAAGFLETDGFRPLVRSALLRANEEGSQPEVHPGEDPAASP